MLFSCGVVYHLGLFYDIRTYYNQLITSQGLYRSFSVEDTSYSVHHVDSLINIPGYSLITREFIMWTVLSIYPATL